MNLIREFDKEFRRFVSGRIIPIVGWLYSAKNKYVNVIYYHDIVTGKGFSFMRTEKDIFMRQMNYLADNGYETLRFDDLDDISKIAFEKKKILIAFDDGWRSNYTEIFEFMKSKNLKYNVFLTIGEIGENPEYMTWNMIRTMHSSGLCGFGAHTYTHPDMSDLSKVDFNHEILEANALFKQELGFSPTDFCYPFGYYSEATNIQLEAKTNYKRLYTSKDMFSYQQNGRIIMGRNGISNDDSDWEFRNKVKGYNNCFYSLRRKIKR